MTSDAQDTAPSMASYDHTDPGPCHRPPYSRGWQHDSFEPGLVVRVMDDSHSRAGNGQRMPPAGALAMAINRNGDCFWHFAALEYTPSGWRLGHRFGAYVFGAKLPRLSERCFHLLMAGESVSKLEPRKE